MAIIPCAVQYILVAYFMHSSLYLVFKIFYDYSMLLNECIIEKKNTAELLPAGYNPRKDLKPGDAEYEPLTTRFIVRLAFIL